MPQVVWIANADGLISYFNRRAEQFAGVRPVDGNFDWLDSIHPDDLPMTQELWQEAVLNDDTYTCEHRLRMDDGAYRWHLSRAIKVTGPGTKAAKWFGSSTDIHDIKLAEEQHRVTEERLRRALDAGDLGIWEIAPKDKYIFWDDRSKELFGLAPDADVIYDQTLWHAIPEDEHPVVRVAMEKALDPSGSGVFDLEHRVRLWDGSIRWLHNLGRAEAGNGSSNGRRSIIRGTVSDITDRKQEETRFALLARLGDLIRSADDPAELLPGVAKAVADTFSASRCFFSSTHAETEIGMVEPQLNDAIVEELASGKTVVVSDSERDRGDLEYSGLAPDERAFIAVPLLRGGILVAAFWVTNKRRRTWSPAEIRAIESVAERTWLAVERLRHEHQLRVSRQTFFNLIQSAPFGVYIVDADFRLAQISAFSEKVFAGIDPLIGRDFAEILRLIWREPFATEAIGHLRQVLETGKPYHSVETTAERANVDDTESYDWLVKRITMPDGSYGVVCYFYDLTERKRAEAKLKIAHERFALAQRAGRVGVWDWDVATNRTYWSETMWEIYGGNPGDINPDQDYWLSYLHREDREEVKGKLSGAIEGGEDRFESEFRIVLGNGEIHWLQSTARILRDDAGNAIRIFGVNLDITERKRAEQQLQDAHDRLEERVAERTQELAESNLALIEEMDERKIAEKQRVELLHRLISSQEVERRRIARDIHDQLGQRLTALRLKIASLKVAAAPYADIAPRIERLQAVGEKLDEEVSFLAWELRPTALDDLGLVDAVAAFVNEWSKHAEINADFHSSDLPKERLAQEIETQLYRITQEALNNILKHAGADHVTVLLERRDNSIILIIEDDGCGFEPADTPRAKSSGGLGLIGMGERAGLVGGEIEIESSLGKGT
ncbi:MAG: PAS domain-containing protein, partial [Pyrinomonadaceae bacterium]